jgi:prepilin-type N-terminal cleavage/methylation domain-containing protein
VKHHRPSPSRGGFTLLEVLVALTIVGLGVVTLLQIFSLGLRLQARSNSRTDAMVQGGQLMDELLARRNFAEGPAAGKFGADGRWTAHIQSSRDAPSSLGLSSDWELKEIALELLMRDGERERQIGLKTLRLGKKDKP